MNHRWTVWIWIALVGALVALFNFYPKLIDFPVVLVAVPVVAVLIYKFYRARKAGNLSFSNEVIGPITALHLIVVSGAAVIFVVLWPDFMLPHVRNAPNELTLFVDVPVVTMAFIAAVTLGIGLYYARMPRR